jgi:hypothetical protein
MSRSGEWLTIPADRVVDFRGALEREISADERQTPAQLRHRREALDLLPEGSWDAEIPNDPEALAPVFNRLLGWSAARVAMCVFDERIDWAKLADAIDGLMWVAHRAFDAAEACDGSREQAR